MLFFFSSISSGVKPSNFTASCEKDRKEHVVEEKARSRGEMKAPTSSSASDGRSISQKLEEQALLLFSYDRCGFFFLLLLFYFYELFGV